MISAIVHEVRAVAIEKPTLVKSGGSYMDIIMRLDNGEQVIITAVFKDQIRLEVQQ